MEKQAALQVAETLGDKLYMWFLHSHLIKETKGQNVLVPQSKALPK